MYTYIVMASWDIMSEDGHRVVGVDSLDYDETFDHLEDAIRFLRIKVREEMDSENPKIIGIRLG